MAKLYNNNMLMNLAKMLISGQSKPGAIAAKKVGASPIFSKSGTFAGFNWGNKSPTDEMLGNAEDVLDSATAMQDISNGVTIPQLGKIALQTASEHPYKTAGLLGLGVGNLGGLTDNDKFGGQLAGLGLGGLGAATLATNPYAAAMMTMGGGALGSLFDKLRARKELEEQQGIPNAGNPIAMLGRR